LSRYINIDECAEKAKKHLCYARSCSLVVDSDTEEKRIDTCTRCWIRFSYDNKFFEKDLVSIKAITKNLVAEECERCGVHDNPNDCEYFDECVCSREFELKDWENVYRKEL